MVSEEGMSFFFRYCGKVYGTDENGRIVFAKLKTKDETPEWRKAAYFTGFELESKSEKKFSEKDLKGIKVLPGPEAKDA